MRDKRDVWEFKNEESEQTKIVAEMIKIGKDIRKFSTYSCKPKTKKELKSIIDDRIEKDGFNCDLNDIDVSLITDMSWLFYNLDFTINISRWDVSKVKNMSYMFACSKFNSDISKWNVRNVENMSYMFCYSEFNHDISSWNVSNATNMSWMFNGSKFNGDVSKWDTSRVDNMSRMFEESKFNQDISNWKIREDCDTDYMYFNCPIEEEHKPKVLR